MSDVLIYLPATSAMWDYNPDNRGVGWTDDSSGRRVCRKGETCAAEIKNAQFNQVSFIWAPAKGVAVSAGVDGQLSTGDGGAGSAQIPVVQGGHSARIQVDGSLSEGGDLGLVGAILKTAVTFQSQPQNFTLDDASSAITYTGWTSTTSSSAPVDAIRSGKFYANTISYTATAGSAASFTYTGQLIYILGCTGPSFGTFQVSIDGTLCGTYNATAGMNTYGTLLYVGQQANGGEHKVEVKNMVDGRLLALDYFVATSAGKGGGDWSSNPAPVPVPVPGPSTTISPVPGQPTVVPGPTPSSIFPGADPALTEGVSDNSGLIGGILGALAGVLLLWLIWRHRKYKKAGGEGSFFASLCGPRKKPPQTAGTAKNDFKLWPMIRFRPKYAT